MRKYLFLTTFYLLLSTFVYSLSLIVDGDSKSTSNEQRTTNNVLFASNITVKLKANKEIVLKGRKFYISKVVDNRDTTGKEIARFGDTKNETVLLLENDLEPYLLYYLSVTYPKTEKTLTPVILIIHSIRLEKDTKLLSNKVNLTMEIEIVSDKTNESLFKYRVGNGIQNLFSDGRTYGKLIERNLYDCLNEFNKNLNNTP